MTRAPHGKTKTKTMRTERTGTACDARCTAPTPAQAHCTVCHVTFGGVSNFDLHRRGGLCLTPESLSLIERRGVWRSEMDAERLEVLSRGRMISHAQ